VVISVVFVLAAFKLHDIVLHLQASGDNMREVTNAAKLMSYTVIPTGTKDRPDMHRYGLADILSSYIDVTYNIYEGFRHYGLVYAYISECFKDITKLSNSYPVNGYYNSPWVSDIRKKHAMNTNWPSIVGEQDSCSYNRVWQIDIHLLSMGSVTECLRLKMWLTAVTGDNPAYGFDSDPFWSKLLTKVPYPDGDYDSMFARILRNISRYTTTLGDQSFLPALGARFSAMGEELGSKIAYMDIDPLKWVSRFWDALKDVVRTPDNATVIKALLEVFVTLPPMEFIMENLFHHISPSLVSIPRDGVTTKGEYYRKELTSLALQKSPSGTFVSRNGLMTRIPELIAKYGFVSMPLYDWTVFPWEEQQLVANLMEDDYNNIYNSYWFLSLRQFMEQKELEDDPQHFIELVRNSDKSDGSVTEGLFGYITGKALSSESSLFRGVFEAGESLKEWYEELEFSLVDIALLILFRKRGGRGKRSAESLTAEVSQVVSPIILERLAALKAGKALADLRSAEALKLDVDVAGNIAVREEGMAADVISEIVKRQGQIAEKPNLKLLQASGPVTNAKGAPFFTDPPPIVGATRFDGANFTPLQAGKLNKVEAGNGIEVGNVSKADINDFIKRARGIKLGKDASLESWQDKDLGSYINFFGSKIAEGKTDVALALFYKLKLPNYIWEKSINNAADLNMHMFKGFI